MSRKTELKISFGTCMTVLIILNENNLNEIEMVTGKLSDVRTNIILHHQIDKVLDQRFRSLYETGK